LNGYRPGPTQNTLIAFHQATKWGPDFAWQRKQMKISRPVNRKAEAVPVTFPTGKGFNLTMQGQISRNPRLNALFNAMMEREREWRDGARAKARADIENAQKSLKELEAAK
jgi:hypothetical protein